MVVQHLMLPKGVQGALRHQARHSRRDDLQTWQKLNVTAFLAGAVAAGSDEVIGEPYEDASGRKYLAMFVQPVLVFVGSAEQLTAAYTRAVAHEVRLGIFTEELFGTNNDADNRAAVAAVPADFLQLVGLALHEQRRLVDKVLRGLRLHPLAPDSRHPDD
jgi:hypothetical protein